MQRAYRWVGQSGLELDQRVRPQQPATNAPWQVEQMDVKCQRRPALSVCYCDNPDKLLEFYVENEERKMLK